MFSKSSKYAIRAVLFLAINSDEDRKIGVDELANKLVVPKHFLAKILQQLTKNKLISSTKGRHGGFYLNQENRSQNLISIIQSFDGKGVFTDCILGLDQCSNENPCPYHDSVQKFRGKFYHQLQKETLEQTAKRVNKLNLKLNNK